MRILAIIFCIATLNLCAQEEDFNRMLMMKSVPVSKITDFCLDSPIKECETTEGSDILSRLFGQTNAVAKSTLYNAYSVSIQDSQGYLFHVADYYDGTRVVTCLNGPLLGLQGVSFKGVKIVESTDVIWFSDYFVHYYPTIIVNSYANQQIIKLY